MMNKQKRGVFVRAPNWCVRAMEYVDTYEVEYPEGFLAIKNSEGVYDCFPIDCHDTRHQDLKEGPCWVANVTAEELGPLGDEDVFLLGKVLKTMSKVSRIETVHLPVFNSITEFRDFFESYLLEDYIRDRIIRAGGNPDHE